MQQSGAGHTSSDDPRLRGMRDLARVALEGRYGAPLGDDIIAAIDGADEATLHDVAYNLTSDMLIDLRRRLGIHT
ncbi:MAG TPA: hypothetical protein VJN88_07690 [Ktedonobacterales bacterium]|nr:hypothetical protein [Ktedonobacterales bacterium]